MTDPTRRAVVSTCLALGICDLVVMNIFVLPDLRAAPVNSARAPVASTEERPPIRLDVEMAPPEITQPVVERAEQPPEAVLVYFATNVYRLDRQARAILDHVAPRLAEGGQTIVVAGYADVRERELDSKRLSRRRALVVARRLREGGVPRSGLVVRAFGATRTDTAGADAGTRHNRRVEIALLPVGQ
jgi:outer membrane protein OmpA-like peptidoglycan-associated protein